jgi:hypothetical protein
LALAADEKDVLIFASKIRKELRGFIKLLGDHARGVIVSQVLPQSPNYAVVQEAAAMAKTKDVLDVSPAMLEGFVSAKVLVEALRRAGPIVVYGFGDNFFKSAGAKGPLSEAKIAAVIDRRHAALNLSPYASRYQFMDIDTCCATYPDAIYVVAISWGGAEVRGERPLLCRLLSAALPAVFHAPGGRLTAIPLRLLGIEPPLHAYA